MTLPARTITDADAMAVTLTVGQLKELVRDAVAASRPQRTEWLNSKEAAKFLGVSERTLLKYRQQTDMPWHEPAVGLLRYRLDELEAWMAQRKAG